MRCDDPDKVGTAMIKANGMPKGYTILLSISTANQGTHTLTLFNADHNRIYCATFKGTTEMALVIEGAAAMAMKIDKMDNSKEANKEVSDET